MKKSVEKCDKVADSFSNRLRVSQSSPTLLYVMSALVLCSSVNAMAIDSGNVTSLLARPSTVMHIGAIIDVNSMKYDDSGVLLGYVLYFKPAPYRNVSLFESRDACGDDCWRIEETTVFDRTAPIVQIIMTNLQPDTQYAYYVKTHMVASESYGGQSDILYFRTLPAPSQSDI